ncbi:hypothetical protein LA080_012002 [Diaporthe eres]|uniref:USP domain-containing protein n=1 Tax=Diaporthe vaccinii TaxID=105482 RepID=A0ABR4DU20_9PEZI|nr:hypothetical protein LA080_012002 [Diaporthe eres]
MDLASIFPVPNWDTQDENEWINVTKRICVSSPYHVRDEQGALSGVDCMVRVIQHLLQSLRRKISQRLIREHRGDNFLVDLAIRNFERDTPVQRQNMQVARDVIWRGLCGQKLSVDGAPSFVEIDQSPLMQGTLWSEPDLQPFHESFIRPSGAESFQTLGASKEYPIDLDTLRTSRSLFVWDVRIHGSFEDMFKAHFERTHFDGANGTYTLFSKAPKVARLLFDPTKARLEGLSIFRLYRMPMNTRRETRQRREGGKGTSNVVYSAADEDSHTYSLVAVVRLRNSPHEHDYVRLYDRDGHPVVPTVPAEHCTSYHSDDWSISDQDHKYMLYYVRFGAQASLQSSYLPLSDMEWSTLGPEPTPAPPVNETAGEVVRRREQAPGWMSTQMLFDSPEAAHWTALERRLAKKQAEQQARQQQPAPRGQGETETTAPGTGTDEQPASSGTQTGSSQRPGSVSLPSRTVPPSSATMPSSSGHQPASAAGPTGQASSVVQDKSSAPPGDSATPGLPPAAEEHDKGDASGKRAADADDGGGDDGPSYGPKSHAQGRESKKTPSSASTRKKKRKRDPLPTYSSSFEEQEREKAR